MELALHASLATLIAMFALGAFAQLKAIYHFVKWQAALSPGQKGVLSFLGPFALLWSRGLTEEATMHRDLFIKWEVVFLCVFALVAVVDFLLPAS